MSDIYLALGIYRRRRHCAALITNGDVAILRTFGIATEDPACRSRCQGKRAEGIAEALPDSPFGGLGALRAAAYDTDLQSSKLQRQGPHSVR
jgi:hypothetical protein